MNQNNANSVLNDQDRMEDLLAQEKYLMSSYSDFIPETSDSQLRSVLTDNFNECVQNQFTIFDTMNQQGWYPVKNAPVNEVDAARQKFQKLQSQL